VVSAGVALTRTTISLAVAAVLGLAVPGRAADDGKALYQSKCAMCHGMDGVARTMAAGARNFNDPAFKKAETVDTVAKIIHDGKGKMPGLGDKLTADQARAIAAYVLTLAK
jgi:mono/diheme cytochrome c family protein